MAQLHLLLFLTLIVSSYAEVLSSSIIRGHRRVSNIRHGGRILNPQPVILDVHQDLDEQQDNVAEATIYRHEVSKIKPGSKDEGEQPSQHTSRLNSVKAVNSLLSGPTTTSLFHHTADRGHIVPSHGNDIYNQDPTFSLSNSIPSVSSSYGVPKVKTSPVRNSNSDGKPQHPDLVISSGSSSFGNTDVSHTVDTSSYDRPSHVDHSVSSLSPTVPSASDYHGTSEGLSHKIKSYKGQLTHFLENSVSSSPVSFPELQSSGPYAKPSVGSSHIGLPSPSPSLYKQSHSSVNTISPISNPISNGPDPYSSLDAGSSHNRGTLYSYGNPISVPDLNHGISGLYGGLTSNSYSQVPFSGSLVPSGPNKNQPHRSSYADNFDGNFVTTPSNFYLTPDIVTSGSVTSAVSSPVKSKRVHHLASPLSSFTSQLKTGLKIPHITLLPTTYPTLTYAPAFPVGDKNIRKATGEQLHPIKSQYHSQDELGQYTFGYKTGDSSRDETRNMYGHVHGQYSYIDANGKVQTQRYIADDKGFRVTGTNLPVHVTDKV